MREQPSAGDLALVDAFIDAFNDADIDRCLSLCRPDLSMATAREWPGGGTYRGHEEVRAFLVEFLADWERIAYEHRSPEAINGRIVERARWVGTGRASGIESSVDFYSVWSLAGGLICRMDVFALREQAREFARTAEK